MRIVITGASGFLGAWASRALVADGHQVTALARSPSPWRLAGVDELRIVVAASTLWPEEIARLAPEVLVVVDWTGVAGQSRDGEVQWSNLHRQRRMIGAALTAGTHRIVGLGSQAEYGPRQDRISENAPTEPSTVYGQAKVAALAQLRELCEAAGVQWVWARVFSIYGPLDNEGLLLPTVADSLSAGRDVDLSSGEQLWSYLYASDAGRAIAHLANSSLAYGVYNVGHPYAPQLRDTIERFATHFDSEGVLRFGAAGPTRITRLEPDVDRLQSTSWEPRVGLTEGLQLTADWLLRRPLLDPFTGGRSLPGRPLPCELRETN
jgi:nucleoside-diphosphate-sugar epimerase